MPNSGSSPMRQPEGQSPGVDGKFTSRGFYMALSERAADRAATGKFPVPNWIHICPSGELVRGRDGRMFRVENPAEIIKATELPIRGDIDHESHHWAGSTKACVWLDRIEYIDEDGTDDERSEPGFWAHVEAWTPTGFKLVETGEYRDVSPVVFLRYESEEARENGEAPFAIGFESIGLTNRPNLDLQGLNSQEDSGAHGAREPAPAAPGKKTMNPDLVAFAVERLGLSANCTEPEFLRGLNAHLQGLVPKEEVIAAKNEAKQAADELHAFRQEQHNEKVNSVLDDAVKSGRLKPFMVDFHRKNAGSAEGLKDLQEYIAQLPANEYEDDDDGAREDARKGSGTISLNEAQRRTAHTLGLSEERYAEELKREREERRGA